MASREEDEGLRKRKERLSKLTEGMEEIKQPDKLLPEMVESQENNEYIAAEAKQEVYPTRKGRLMVTCGCGRVFRITDDIIEDGINFTMIVGEDAYIKLHCDECGSDLKLSLIEIDEEELQQESNKE